MSSYHLISWGANSHGQLGQGILSEQCILPQEIELAKYSLKPENIKKIVGGAGHTLILDTEGHVYSCGWNNKGQTGRQSEQEHLLIFQRIRNDLDDKIIVDICCGWDSSAAVTEDGELYLWGSNRYGQLGRDPSILRSTARPFKYPIDEKVKCISMGLRHTAVVTNCHNLLMCGANGKGQLGLINLETGTPCEALYAFTEVSELSNIESVACGQHHTIVATLERDIYVFGDNKYGQAGFDPQICMRILHPAKLLSSHFIAPAQIHAGWTHVNILSDGVIFSWGRNNYGQLGQLARINLEKIRSLENIPRIVELSVGSEHNIALAENGTILCWGWNEHGNCGNGNTKNVLLPERLPISSNSVGVLIGAGAGHSFAVIKD